MKSASSNSFLRSKLWATERMSTTQSGIANFRYEEESGGLDDIEDLGSPGTLSPDYALGLFRVSFSDLALNLCSNNNTSYLERETGGNRWLQFAKQF